MRKEKTSGGHGWSPKFNKTNLLLKSVVQLSVSCTTDVSVRDAIGMLKGAAKIVTVHQS